ncbi:hypothetical protein N7501_000004 [Penicillium viridicatum]|nr:hypothetical protein N7501_000004 [Penicillium viridicatum]
MILPSLTLRSVQSLPRQVLFEAAAAQAWLESMNAASHASGFVFVPDCDGRSPPDVAGWRLGAAPL